MTFSTIKLPQDATLGVHIGVFATGNVNTNSVYPAIKSQHQISRSTTRRPTSVIGTWLCCILMLLIAGCSTPQKVIQFVNKEANFSEYYSYSIINYKAEKTKHAKVANSFLTELEAEITNEMDGRAYSRSDEPDLLVRYETASGIKTSSSSPNYYDNPYSYNPYDPLNQPRTRKHIEGLLLIEIKDKAKKLVWQGSLDIRFSKNNEENPAIIKAAVHRIFETYPYQAGSDQPIVLPSEDSKK